MILNRSSLKFSLSLGGGFFFILALVLIEAEDEELINSDFLDGHEINEW